MEVHGYVGPDDDPDKYRLVRKVGRGGEAELWEADLSLSGGRERVAVKILHADLATDAATWRARWQEQVDTLQQIRHSGVVSVHCSFEGARVHQPSQADRRDRALYLVMSWVDGQNLKHWRAQHTRPEDHVEVFRYLAQVADVLDWLHSGRAISSGRPVLHCDITPSNGIISPDGTVVLVDFGLVRIAQHVTKVPRGTPGYCAPEVGIGEYSPATDRYAFGGLAFYLLTGSNPPTNPRRQIDELAAAAGSDGNPARLDQLAQIFADDPDSRPTAREWLRLLRCDETTVVTRGPMRSLAAGVAIRPGGSGIATHHRVRRGRPATVAVRPRRGRRRLWIVATTTAVAGAALILGLTTAAPPRTPAATIPEGFLVYEAMLKTEPDEESGQWFEFDLNNNLIAAVTAPCQPPDASEVSHSDARSVKYFVWAGNQFRGFTETLIVYPDEHTAKRVVAEQRDAVDACPSITDLSGNLKRISQQAVEIGDEAMRVSEVGFGPSGQPMLGGTRSLVVRRGVAVLFYNDTKLWKPTASPEDFAQMEEDAGYLVEKMCIFDPDCRA